MRLRLIAGRMRGFAAYAIFITFVLGLSTTGSAIPFEDLTGWQNEPVCTFPLPPGVLPEFLVPDPLNPPNTSATVNENKGCIALFGGNIEGSNISLTIGNPVTLDGDRFGFVLGFNVGDTTVASADYLVVEWRGAGGNPPPLPGPQLDGRGLSLLRAQGELIYSDFVNRVNGVTELARAKNLGDMEWAVDTDYLFTVTFTAQNLTISVDGVEEFDYRAEELLGAGGLFNPGPLALYNLSQQDTEYRDITIVPEPTTAFLLAAGLAGLVVQRRRA